MSHSAELSLFLPKWMQPGGNGKFGCHANGSTRMSTSMSLKRALFFSLFVQGSAVQICVLIDCFILLTLL
eukprot:3488297-Amphidinium_carterae.1